MKILLGIFFICFISILHCNEEQTLNSNTLYFSYSEDELAQLREIPVSEDLLNPESLFKWDPLIDQITAIDKTLDGVPIRLMAYLYVAQREFALLSYQISQKWAGNPDQMIAMIIRLFYSDFQSSQSLSEDLYSQKLREIVFRKIKERLVNEEAHLKEYPVMTAPDHWNEKPPINGQRIGSCQTWLLTSVKEFRAPMPPPPNSIIWIYGIEQIKIYLNHLSAKQQELIKYWAGELGPQSGNWFAIVNQFLKDKQVSFPNFLMIRAIIAMGFTDAMIAAYDSKYTYWVRRPTMLDPSLKSFILVPKHPSYPSAHSTTSSATATILSRFFPNEKQKWEKLAIQAGDTRIWAGLHFIYDHEQGLIQGEKVGNAIMERVSTR
jgi:hypothetical protein